MQLEAGGLQVECRIEGRGAPLLLMHGAEGDHHMFDALLPHLAPHFTVIAYDQRDCGGTTGAADAPATLAELADDAQALLLALGHARAAVYGSSFGGRVAQMFAHRHAAMTGALVIGGTWALPDALAELNPQAIAHIQRLRAALPDSAEELAGYFLPESFLAQQPQYRAVFRNVNPHSPRSQRRAAAVADHPPLAPSQLDVPTLVLVAELDRVVPPAVTHALARAIPGARAVVLDGVGHAAAIQAPERVAAEIVRFCKGEG